MSLVSYLQSLPMGNFLSGQTLNCDNRTPTNTQLLQTITPVAMLQANILVGDNDATQYNTPNLNLLTAHANAGGVIVLCFHMPNPWSSVQDLSSAWVTASWPRPVLQSLLNGSGAPQTHYQNTVKRIISFVQQLPSTATVILRPWHEAGGENFWWSRGASTSPTQSEDGVKALWTDTVSQVKASCSNVLSAFSAAMSWYSPIMYGYVNTADLVGASLYSDTVQFAHDQVDYQSLVTTGKPVILFEQGQAGSNSGWDARKISNAIVTNYPAIKGVICWTDVYSLFDDSNSNTYLTTNGVTNRNQLPQLVAKPTSYVYSDHNPGPLHSQPAVGLTQYPVY